MEPLAVQFEDRTYCYTQLTRYGDLALYEQRHKYGPTVRYEVVRIRVQRARTWPDGHATPDMEVYPSPSSWGLYGWTFFHRTDGEAWMRQLQTDPTPDAPEGEEAADASLP